MSSWYPVPERPTHGLFVQRHAMAAALLNDVCVLYAAGSEREAQEPVIRNEGPFRERIYFYNKKGKSGFSKYKALVRLYEKGFEEILKEWGKPDIIHLNVIFPAGIFALRLCRKYGIPLVITEHWTGYLPEDGSYRGFIKTAVTKSVARRAAVICPVTGHLGRRMQQLGLGGKKYVAVPNVVDTDFFSPGTAGKDEPAVFLHLSSFDERQKNPKSILDAFRNVMETTKNIRLVMAGDGNTGLLEDYAARIGINGDQAEFHFCPQGEALLRLFRRADALVLNSSYENLPVVLLEAMSCGLPVISSDVGGIKEYVTQERGILFSPPSVAALEAALRQFILNKSRFSSSSIRSFAVSHFGRETIARQLNQVYNSVLC